jgi:putative phosphoesterase
MDDFTVAFLSDIHGNRWALEAVLADIKRRGIQEIFNLGDSLYGPLDPVGTAKVLMELDLPTVRGNEDRIIFETSGQSAESPTLRYVRNCLGAEVIGWLRTLEMTMNVRDTFFLCHGSPFHDSEYLLVEVKREGVFLRNGDELLAKTSNLKQSVLCCGHDHVPRTVLLPDRKLIVNPGSVGLPAYTDDLPYPHRMETGTPHARYAIISSTKSGWLVEDAAVPYEWEAASAVARENGRPDWSRWLVSGRAGVQ